ncbi:claspin isoform X1 [Nothobranchius furzeri]|uniref:Transcript variant X1 n=1 Tax=Nothobranchius furzeri TaxID=105023 RepID=A0A8C6LIW8_NOTFU|nr:transcript variant X1 [Nothobranchius furzeri]
MSLVLSHLQTEALARAAPQSHWDSGMGPPAEEEVPETSDRGDECPDSDDDITVHRKPRRNAIRDSDSEEEEAPRRLELSEEAVPASSEDEERRNKGGQRSNRKARASDGSDGEHEEEEENKREKSQRHRKKKEKRSKVVESLKRRRRSGGGEEDVPLPPALNDSGCPLGDPELFSTGLEEEEEEESLDAIRAAVRQKVKKHKDPLLEEEEEDEEVPEKPQRAERKAARASKEAMKQLHSESQRLVRESTLGLPYHIPEPKTIEQFFKRRTRPEGSAMALLKSTKYSEVMLETPAPPGVSSSQSQPLPQPAAASSPQQENEVGGASDLDPDPALMLFLSESLQDSADADPAGNPPPGCEEETSAAPPDQNRTSEAPKEPPVDAAAEPAKAKSKLARLKALGMPPPPVARLCPDDGAFVQLEPPHLHPGVEALKERYLRHIHTPVRPQAERTMHLTVIRKDCAPSGREELTADSVTVTLKEGVAEEPAVTKPGEKLLTLKQRLQVAMAHRRQEERTRRAELHRLDNEDCEEEEEEEELTDESEQEEGVEDLLGGDDGEEEENTAPSVRSRSPSAPTPDLVNADGTLLLFPNSSCSRTGDGVRKSGGAGCDCSSKTEEDSSFDLAGSMITSYQPVSHQRSAGRGVANFSTFHSMSPCLFRPSVLGSASKSSGRLSEPSLCLPVEDSQDLYAPPSPGADSGPMGGAASGPGLGGDSQGRFSLEDDAHSQLLDADGFLNVGPRPGAPRSHKRKLVLDSLDENAMDANMGELLGLCSGGFDEDQHRGTTQQDELLGLCSGAFPQTQEGRREELHGTTDQLMGLGSGEFTEADSVPTTSSAENRTKTEEEQEEEEQEEQEQEEEEQEEEQEEEEQEQEQQEEEEQEQEEDDCEFHLLSDVESEKEEEEQVVFTHRLQKKKKITLMDYVDSEAELSGSDLGSDDEDDDGGGSEYEEEELLEELPSDEELQNQVNKIHMKQLLDDDKRRLRLYQEQYLADGDLHSDGPGRARRFRWRNIDDVFGGDGAGPGGNEDGDEEEDVDVSEVQRRKDRLEREQWLREQSEQESRKGRDEDEELGGEDSRFMKLAQKLTARTLQRTEPPAGPQPEQKSTSALNPFQRPSGPPQVRRGSLLSQPQAVLQKLASISDGNLLAPRNSRGFLFQTLSPEKVGQPSNAPQKQVMKRRSQAEVASPSAKRICRETESSQRSIFSFLDH